MAAESKPSRAVYVRRRLVVGLVAVMVIGGAAGGVGVLVSDDDTDTATDVSTTIEVSATSDASATSTVVEQASTSSGGTASTVAATEAPATTAGQTTVAATTDAATTAPASTDVASATAGQDALPQDPSAPVIDAAAYGVYDVNSGEWLTATNADAQRPVGSIMKLLTAYVVMEAGDPTKIVTVPDLNLDPMESAIGLYPGEQLPREVLLRAMLIVSANDAAETLAIDVGGTRENFVQMMNAAADELGLDGTVASNPSGLDGGAAESTVRDAMTLAALLMQDSTFRATVARTSANLHGQSFPATNELLGVYSGADGVKTGSTTQGGYGMVASATRAAHTIIVVVLGAETEDARFAQAAELLDWGFTHPA